MLEQALKYAARGISVFPCWPATKEPACRHGFKDATTNPATIRRWWVANDSYNIAIATGIVSRVSLLMSTVPSVQVRWSNRRQNTGRCRRH